MSYSEKSKNYQRDRKTAAIRVQLFGKDQSTKYAYSLPNQSIKADYKISSSEVVESKHLSQDLFKSFTLAVFIILTEFTLFLGVHKNLIKF